ncbi:MAG TPA: hypothetical protein VHX11_00040 [Acidobacteriaceae bacterium]|jgi:hypothetical protein|nr:hypothetical protein [Acidobacteriaceae bacterium]
MSSDKANGMNSLGKIPEEEVCGCDANRYAQLNIVLGQLAERISTLNAPARVRDHCLSEARFQAAESWALPRALRLPGHSGAFLRVAGLGAAGLVAALVCYGVFLPGNFQSIARFLPGHKPAAVTASVGASGSSAVADDSGYVSLPYSDPSIANGTETTVEVTMPVSQLMAWGVPTPGRGPDDEVPVDLVLGDDGLPRAVQVLPTTSSTNSSSEEFYP